MSSRAHISEQEAGRIRIYEPPAISVIGPLSKITLGSGGGMADALNKLKK
jgi:hypothetical protein